MTRIILILLVSVIFSHCKSFEKFPPIPDSSMSTADELKYIYKTDQRDRVRNMHRFIFGSEEKYLKNPKVIAVSDRDSFRLARVIEFDRNTQLKSDEEKYLAAFIHLHGGGLKMLDNNRYQKRCYELAKEIYDSTDNKKYRKRAKFLMEESQSRIE